MKLGFTWSTLAVVFLAVLLGICAQSQQNGVPIQQDAGQASQPATSTPSADNPNAPVNEQPANGNAKASPGSSTGANANADDNPYDPLLEPPPLPKGKTTLIGGTATSVDHVRNHLTVQPFGGGKKVKLFLDERSHIYRNGTETTILGIHRGDRVYVDTMLANDTRIFARNIRVLTESGLAEVRGQVISADPGRSTINVRDQLSAKPVSFSVSGATKYSSTKGAATVSDLQPGSLIEVQFSPRQDRAVAQEIVVLAKPGDNYIFSGVVTSMDLRTNSFFVDNKSDDQSYEVHFSRAVVSDPQALKVGAEVTARTTFDGKQYTASNVRVEKTGQDQPGEQSKAQ